jgi:hypothetical protein
MDETGDDDQRERRRGHAPRPAVAAEKQLSIRQIPFRAMNPVRSRGAGREH